MITAYVQSYRRPDMTLTRDFLTPLGVRVVGCVRAGEKRAYEHVYESLLVVPDSVTGLHETRQFVLDKVRDEVYVMCDDDVRGFLRKDDIALFGGVRKADNKFARRLLTWMLVHADEHEDFAGAVIDRFTIAKPSKVYWREWGFMRQFFVLKNVRGKARFDRMNPAQDKDFSLQVLKAGIPVRIPSFACVDSPIETEREDQGGCGPLRAKLYAKHGKDEIMRRLARRLAELHPDVVQLTPDFKQRVSWKGARDIGRTARGQS